MEELEAEAAVLHVLVEEGEEEDGEEGEGVGGPRVGLPRIEEEDHLPPPVEGHVHHGVVSPEKMIGEVFRWGGWEGLIGGRSSIKTVGERLSLPYGPYYLPLITLLITYPIFMSN